MFSLKDILIGCQEKRVYPDSLAINLDQVFCSAQHDSRRCRQQDLYVAIKGQRVDGHDFIPDALQAGATGIVCSRLSTEVSANALQIVVPDVTTALQGIAKARVSRQSSTIKIGVTGSSGKTTTKEAIAAILSLKAPTLKTYASYNNELGYPLTLLQLEDQHRYAVLEMGAERVGELRALCEMVARPDWSVITTVGAAHLKHFGSLENVAIAKSELVEVLAETGVAFLNYDDPVVREMKKKTRAEVIYYGRDKRADVYAHSIQAYGLEGSSFILQIYDQQIAVRLKLVGQHGITIALAAAAVGYRAGIPLTTIGATLELLEPVQGRGEIKMGEGPGGSTLIDDSYNAIRPSIITMVDAMQTTHIASGGKRWAVLGELLEQGEYARTEHFQTGQALVGKVDYLVALGDYARYYVEGAIAAGMPAEQTCYFPVDPIRPEEVEMQKQKIAEMLQQKATAQDLILIKGSRRMHMETLFSMFKA